MATKIRMSSAINEYCEHMAARGLASGTIRSRREGLGQLQRIVGDQFVCNITHRHIDAVFAAHTWSTGSRNNRLAQYKAFFEWARSRQYMDRDDNPTFGWRNNRVVEQPKERIPAAQWSRLFAACKHPQETIVVATGLFLFLRGSEQQAIQLKHIRLEDGEIDIYRRKTREWDTMPISKELDGYLRAHLKWMAEQGFTDSEHFLIASRNRDFERDVQGRLVAGTGTINPNVPFGKPHLTVQRVLERAGFPTSREGEHTLRRSGARAYFDVLAEAGYDGALRRVQAMLGHKNSIMTEIYLGLDLDRRQRNEDIKGQEMFPALHAENVVPLREAM